METYIEVLESTKRRSLIDGVDINFGKLRIQTLFTGFFNYHILNQLRCRACRLTYDVRWCETCEHGCHDHEQTCSLCGGTTIERTHCRNGHELEITFDQTQPKRCEYPEPFNNETYVITLETTGTWLSADPALGTILEATSPCLMTRDNYVLAFIRRSVTPEGLMQQYKLTADEADVVFAYHERGAQILTRRRPRHKRKAERLLPAVYGQCLRERLLRYCTPARAATIFAAITGYPIDRVPTHVCTDCRSNMLYPALHTLEHQLLTVYPSVVNGDRDDISGVTQVIHESTGRPTLFVYDNYEGGIGASEKIYDHFDRMLEHALNLRKCACGQDSGCPLCVKRSRCPTRNEHLSKNAAQALLYRLLGLGEYEVDDDIEVRTSANGARGEPSNQRRTVQARADGAQDPFELLRVLPQVHNDILDAAFKARAEEADFDKPPFAMDQLHAAFDSVREMKRPVQLRIEANANPYAVLHLRETASFKMVQKVRRALAVKLHPDTRSLEEQPAATQQLQIVNDAVDRIRREPKNYGDRNGEP